MGVRVRSTLRRFLAGAMFWGALVCLGCAHGTGREHAFRRFWDRPHSHATPNPRTENSRHDSKPDGAEDSFVVTAAEETARAQQNRPADLDGPPFRLVEHQTPVTEISSEPDAGDAVSPAPGIDSQTSLERLKIAIHRDAKAPLPLFEPEQSAETARPQVEAMMRNARREMQRGDDRAALRWASAAERLAQRSNLFFGPDEDPPAELERMLRDRLKMTEPAPAPPEPTQEEHPPQPSSLSTEFSEQNPNKNSPLQGNIPPLSSPHTTQAMKQAAIAPETLGPRPAPPRDPSNKNSDVVCVPAPAHRRSLKVDARRVSANLGAVVSVEGQLNPPAESPLPTLPLAPPASEDGLEMPKMEMDLPQSSSASITTPPPLPPPSEVEVPRFSYANPAEAAPLPEPVKNVQWNEPPPPVPEEAWDWWVFPAIGLAGLLLIGLVALKHQRG